MNIYLKKILTSLFTGAILILFTLKFVQAHDLEALLKNSSDGEEKCLIFSNNGTYEYPTRHNWGTGPLCGFPGGKTALLANEQAVWKLIHLESDLYLILNYSNGEEKCLIFSNNGTAYYPTRYNWGTGSFCGFPGGKAALLANKQAVWNIRILTNF